MSQNTINTKSHDALPTVGILGAGQLSTMMSEAYQKMGGKVIVFDASADSPACKVADQYVIGSTDSLEDLVAFFKQVDVVTLENEFIDSQLLIDASSQSSTTVLPDPSRYSLIEDKLSENLFFQNLGIDIAEFFEVKTQDDLIDQPGYLKLAKGGYDGIGTYKVGDKAEAISVFNTIKSSGVVLFEHNLAFKKELSMIAVASADELVFYPLVETFQEHGTCRYVEYPCGVSADVEQKARDAVTLIMNELGTQGLFAFEFFLTQDDQLVLNESAPRPHNSGHITLDLHDCSQFESHMRAIAGLSLRHPELKHDSMVMVNLLGTRNAEFDANTVLDDIGNGELSVTLYGKKQSRVKRKMAHVNLWGDDRWQRAKHIVQSVEI